MPGNIISMDKSIRELYWHVISLASMMVLQEVKEVLVHIAPQVEAWEATRM